MRSALFIFATLAFFGCDRSKPVDYDAKLLFEKDGCKIYKFVDDGATKYFTHCPNANESAAMWTDKKIETIIPTSK